MEQREEQAAQVKTDEDAGSNVRKNFDTIDRRNNKEQEKQSEKIVAFYFFLVVLRITLCLTGAGP